MIAEIQELLAAWAKEITTPEPNRLDVRIEADDLLKAAAVLSEHAYLSAITGLDVGSIEVLYHFGAGIDMITLRVLLPREAPAIHSICKVIPSAQLYERELREMFGVKVIGLADLDYLFLPEDWVEGVYPLRKDAVLPE